jgi:hypothetical protein
MGFLFSFFCFGIKMVLDDEKRIIRDRKRNEEAIFNLRKRINRNDIKHNRDG